MKPVVGDPPETGSPPLPVSRLRGVERRSSVPLGLLVVGGLAGVAFYGLLAHGPGLSHDSMIYIDSARGILRGDGVAVRGKPLTGSPPAYPWVLAGLAFATSATPLQAARLLASILYGLNLVLICEAVRRAGAPRALVATTGLFFLSSAPILTLHAMAWSEPLYLAVSTTGLILLARYLDAARPSPGALVASSLAVGLSPLTRYVGVALIPPTVVAILALQDSPRRSRLRRAFLHLCLATAPLASWLGRNLVAANTATDRPLVLHPPNTSHVRRFVASLHDFFLPLPLSAWTKVGVVAAILGGFAFASRDGLRRFPSNTTWLFLLYAASYVLVVVVALTFLDANVPVDFRILSPALLALLVAGVSGTAKASGPEDGAAARTATAALLLCACANVPWALSGAAALRHDGLEYGSVAWQRSELLDRVRRMPPASAVYSNGANVVRFFTGRMALPIPPKASARTGLVNQAYEAGVHEMIEECRSGRALIAYFDGIAWPGIIPSAREIESLARLPVLERVADGVIYGRPAPRPALDPEPPTVRR